MTLPQPSIQDVKELFGRRWAQAAVIIFFVVAGYLGIDFYTGGHLHNRILNLFRPPVAVTHFWESQAPPYPTSGYINNKYAIYGISLDAPLRLSNQTDQVVFVEDIELQWHILNDFNDYENYEQILSPYASAAPLSDSLKRYEGGSLKGSASQLGIKYEDETDLHEHALRGFKPDDDHPETQLFPLKLDPYEDVTILTYFDLAIKDKANNSTLVWRVTDRQHEKTFTQLIPIFFGSRSLDDHYHDGTITLHTSVGTDQIHRKFYLLFIGTQLHIPPKEK